MFCRNCAEVMLDTDITCPNCGFAAGTGVKYCAQCGSETPAGAVICEICGNPVSSIPMAGQPAAQQPFQQVQQAFQQAAQPFQQAFRQAQPNFQQPQQPFQQQTQQSFQQPFQQASQSFQQPGAQQFRSADPNQAFGQPGSYSQPNTFQQPGAQQFRSADPNQAFGQPGTYSQPNTFQQNATGQYYQNVTYKSKVGAGLLGIFLGCFGVHNFYLGYTSKAVVQLLLTLLSCGTLAIISEIWGLVEGIMILTGSINQDGRGLPLKD